MKDSFPNLIKNTNGQGQTMKFLTSIAFLTVGAAACDFSPPDQAISQPPSEPTVFEEQELATEEDSSLVGTYQYTYPHNTADLNEDHFIMIYEHGGELHGTYFGTSDDFDPAREGYKPGYYYAEMQNLQLTDSTISFVVEVTDSTMYQHQITPFVKAAEQRPWQGTLQRYTQGFSGTIEDDVIKLPYDHFQARLFVKVRAN